MPVQRCFRKKVKQKSKSWYLACFETFFFTLFCLLTLLLLSLLRTFSLLLRLDYTRTYKHISLHGWLPIKSGRWIYSIFHSLHTERQIKDQVCSAQTGSVTPPHRCIRYVRGKEIKRKKILERNVTYVL